jgi:TonB-linked SusC/RagA family outer membrane protein
MKKQFFTVLSILFLGTLLSGAINAQGVRVTGKVTDVADGSALTGVTIQEKGTNNGTNTDTKGNYSITVAPTAIMNFTYVGYIAQEVSVNGRTSINVALSVGATNLQEVVVIGYGTLRKKDVTGSISTISSSNLNQGATTNPLQQIAGKAAGVVISKTGSEPGTSPSVRIRGITSLIGGSDPLVVIDGIQGNLELLNQLPPSEIESVDILKDASSTAIYGSRGAPGVILVTTKKSKAGTSTIEYSSTVSLDMIPKKLDVLNADEWYTQAQKWGVPVSANHGSSTNWYDLLTKNGSTQNHNASIGGGTNSFNYRASLSAILQEGLVINSNNKNYIGRIQATQKALDEKLTVTMSLNSGIATNVGSPQSIGRAAFTSNLISNTYVSRPTDPVYNSDGSYFTDPNVFQYINPYAVAQTVVNEQQTNNLFGSLRADFELTKGLTAGWFGSWRKVDGNSGYYLPAQSTVAYAIDNNGVANINNNHQDEKLMDVSLNYKRVFGDHSIDAIAVYEWQKQTYNGNFTQVKGFVNDIATYNALQLGNLTSINPGDISSYKNDRSIVSFLGRINYSYLNRYLFTASIRQDASSVFGANNKSGNFPSASVAWRLSEESFMKGFKFLNDLKLRLGYGITGNQQGLSPQNSLRLVGASGITYFGGNTITNFAIAQNSNSDLRWETRSQENIGIDFAFLNSRISGSIDAYSATTKNLLFNYNAPQPPYPFGTIVANVGSLLNEGIDMSLNVHLIKSDDFNFSINGNLSLLRNKVLELSGSINGVPLNTDYVSWGTNSYLIKGKPIGTFYILKHLGKTDTNEETVVDNNNDGIIDSGNQSPDRFYEGSALPTYTYAFSPVFNYKYFDLTMLFRGSGGNKIYNSIRSSFSYFENIGKSNMLTSAIPLGLFTSKYGSDLWLEDGSYLRIENLNLGYRFDIKKLKYISALRLSLTATNLALFTKYKGLDPELNASGGSGFGIDGGIYPRSRTIAIGINLILK